MHSRYGRKLPSELELASGRLWSADDLAEPFRVALCPDWRLAGGDSAIWERRRRIWWLCAWNHLSLCGSGSRIDPYLMATSRGTTWASALVLMHAIGAALPMLAIVYAGPTITICVRTFARHSAKLQRAVGVMVIAFAIASLCAEPVPKGQHKVCVA